MKRVHAGLIALGAVPWLLSAACSRPSGGDRAVYDPETGKLVEILHDANGNGRVETWTEMDGAKPLRSRIDRDEDGVIDRWEYYGPSGELVKVGMSRGTAGRPDAWAYPASADGTVRIEASSAADESRIDRWERYARSDGADGTGALLSVEADTNGDGRPDRWETYDDGQLATTAFDENGDGRPDRRLTYRGGSLVLLESDPDPAGAFRRRIEVK